MLERLGKRPLATQARDTILDAILRQQFHGGRLPTEDELASMLDVSRTTIRTALHSLEQDGIVRRRRALGTTINPHVGPNLVALQRLAGFEWQLREKGYKVGVNASWRRGAVPDEFAEAFGLGPRLECFLSRRVYFADNVAAIDARDIIPWNEIETPPRRALPPSLCDLCSKCCRETIDHAVVKIVPTVKQDESVTKIGVALGTPFVRLHERHYSSEGREMAFSVIDVDDEYIRFEVFRRT